MKSLSKVLVVDDSLLGRVSVKRELEGMDLIILEAQDGHEALEILEKENPQIIFLDLLMPRKDGMDVLMDLKNMSDPPKVIIVSADIQDTTRKQCLDAGASAFLNKPFSKEELDLVLMDLFGDKP